MTPWGVADAKARFSSVLDKAESEGPQLVRRRKRDFYVLTKDELEARTRPPAHERKTILSAWDALRPSPGELFEEVEFLRLGGSARVVEF